MVVAVFIIIVNHDELILDVPNTVRSCNTPCLSAFPRLSHTQTQPAALNMAVLSSLQLDGESVYSLVSNPLLLLLTRVIFVNCGAKLETLQVRYTITGMQ